MKVAVLAVASLSFALPLRAQTPATTPAPAPAVRQKLPNDSLELARKYTNWIWTANVDSLQGAMEPGGQQATRQEMLDQLAQMSARVGAEASLVEERWVRRNGMRQYWRIANFTDFTAEPVVLRIVIMPSGKIGGLGFNPLSRVPPVDQEP